MFTEAWVRLIVGILGVLFLIVATGGITMGLIMGAVYGVLMVVLTSVSFTQGMAIRKSDKLHAADEAKRTTTFTLLGKEISFVHLGYYDPHYTRGIENEVRENGGITSCGKADCERCHDEILCVDDDCKICNPPSAVQVGSDGMEWYIDVDGELVPRPASNDSKPSIAYGIPGNCFHCEKMLLNDDSLCGDCLTEMMNHHTMPNVIVQVDPGMAVDECAEALKKRVAESCKTMLIPPPMLRVNTIRAAHGYDIVSEEHKYPEINSNDFVMTYKHGEPYIFRKKEGHIIGKYDDCTCRDCKDYRKYGADIAYE